jgi:Pentapeptide repeats (9 copies)/Pentapeptide repeats (8 copies)
LYQHFWALSFKNSNLDGADFSNSNLKNSNFYNSKIDRVLWKSSKNLKFARVENSYLKNNDLLNILVTGKGNKVNLESQDLRGINFSDTNLDDILFSGSDLTGASFTNSILFEVDFSHANLNQVNFSFADLTGAYLERSGLTNTTKIDGLRGDYIYMNRPNRGNRCANRFPPIEQGNFAPGGLKNFLDSLINTIDLYHTKDFDPRAVVIALEEIKKEVKEEFEIVALEKTEDGQVIIKVKAATDCLTHL